MEKAHRSQARNLLRKSLTPQARSHWAAGPAFPPGHKPLTDTRSGLRRIILIDGHIPDVITRLDVADHATLIGTNGAGKTTLLKLLPLFYGIAPGQLESGAAGKKKFVDWYLPRASSLLVFEYHRDGAECCAVMSRHPSGTKLAYNFLHAPFTEAAFTRENLLGERELLLGKELWRVWKSQGLECSKRLDIVTDYRAVIQRDLSQSSNARELRPLAVRYGLGSSKTRMQHIEKVVHALVGRQGSMEKIKLMLAAIMRDEGVSVPKLPAHQSNEAAISDLAGLRQLKTQLPKLQQTVTDNLELLRVEASLLSLGAALNRHQSLCAAERETLQEADTQLQQQLEKLHAEWQQQQDSLNARRSEHRAEVKNLSEQIEKLDQQRDAWQERDIDSWAEKLKALPQYQAALTDAQARYDALTGQLKELEQRFEQRRQALRDDLHQAKQHAAERKNALQQQRQDQRDEQAKQERVVSARYREQTAQLQARQQQAREGLLTEQASLQAQIENAGYLEDERSHLRALEQDQETAEQAQQAAAAALHAAETGRQQAQSTLQAASEQERKARHDLQQRQAEYAKQQQIAYPDDRSLLSSLRQQFPGWEQHIGRVIDPELLQRKDLTPDVTAADSSFYGLSLALDKIDPPGFAADEAQLAASLQAAADRRDNAATQQQVVEAELAQANATLRSAEQACMDAQQQHKSAQRRFQAARDANRAAKCDADEALAGRRGAAKAKAEQLAKQLATNNKQAEAEIAELSEQEKQALAELAQAGMNNELQLQSREAEISQQLSASEQGHKDTLKQLDNDLTAAQQEEGIDADLLRDAKAELAKQRQHIEALQARQTAVQDYQDWQQNRWPRRQPLQDERIIAEQVLSQAEHELKDGEASFKTARQKLEAKQRAQQQRSKQLNGQLEQINQSSSRIRSFSKLAETLTALHGIASSAERNENLDALLHETSATLGERESLLSKVRSAVHSAEAQVGRSTATIAQAWRSHRDAVAEQSGIAADAPDDWRAQARVLESILRESLQQEERSLVDTMLAIGGQVNDFYMGLAAVKGKIDSESRRISKAIDQALCVDVLADIKVRLSSRVEELEYWTDLERFHRHWQDWELNAGRELPPEAFTDSLGGVLKALAGSRITGEVESLFDLEISLTENGRNATVRNDRDLQEVSSTGLSFLALCSIFIGLTRLLCVDRSVNIHWPLDELGTLAPENVSRLFRMLSDNGIVILGGFPSNDLDLLKHFTHRYTIDRERGLVEVTLENDELADLLGEVAA